MKLKDRGYVQIKLDKERHLKFDFTASRKYEESTGKLLSNMEQGKIGISDINYWFWAALLHEMPELTIEQAEKLMLEAESVTEISQKVTEAVHAFFGDPPKEKN